MNSVNPRHPERNNVKRRISNGTMQKHGAELTLKQKNHNMQEPIEKPARFFNPYRNKEKYPIGINGKKVLVLGASFYCDKECPKHEECTNPETRISRDYDTTCPEYVEKGLKLSDEPSNVDASYRAYKNFQRLVTDATGIEDMWQYIAFTNYVQFMLPSYRTKKSYLTEHDYEAFNQTLIELKPDVVISWGVVILEEIREKNKYSTDLEKLPETEWYISHIEMEEVGHPITLLSVYHPSSSAWYTDYQKALKYLRDALDLIPKQNKN